MKPKQDSRWPDAHIRLKKLYEARVPAGMSQEEFGHEYGIGSQGMVWQYLNGYTPLNYDAAAKFAKGLRCTIEDISPSIVEALKADIFPFVRGKAWKRVAVLAALLVAPNLLPHDAYAAASVENALGLCIKLNYRLLKLWLLSLLPPTSDCAITT